MTSLAVCGLHKSFGHQPVLAGLSILTCPPAPSPPSSVRPAAARRRCCGFWRASSAPTGHGRDRRGDGRGRARRARAPEQRRIGYVPQEGSLFPHLTVEANVGFGLRARQRRAARTTELLDDGRAGRARRALPASALRRPAAAGRARPGARHQARLVLLDEPFASLDASLRASVREDVRRASRRARDHRDPRDPRPGRGALHRRPGGGDARRADRAVRSPRRICTRSPVDADMARFVGEANSSSGVLDGSRYGPTGLAPGGPAQRPVCLRTGGHRAGPARADRSEDRAAGGAGLTGWRAGWSPADTTATTRSCRCSRSRTATGPSSSSGPMAATCCPPGLRSGCERTAQSSPGRASAASRP